MLDTAQCARCDTALSPEEAVQSVCPRCLLGVALANEEIEPLESDDPLEAIDALGQRIGPFEIVEVLGEGGMGVVYLAEQREPFHRRVALKLIKAGMDTREVIARFETERRTLALMDHPHIARVYDAGATPRGRSYFVMEYVPGVAVTQYCDERRLDLASRLRLFVDACRAIQHAHQKGIVHRDIKPNNLLVTEVDNRPVLKVIDFGIAKAIDRAGVSATRQTRQGLLLGTPEYMAPELLATGGRDVDTRTDVYALGLTLYELVAGRPPFDRERLQRLSLDEFRRHLREVELPRPSERAAGDGAAARRALTGDLDWIVMKALEKAPERRYGSPNEMADDVLRHLTHQPVLAGPPSAGYRLRKFVRRHRVGVAFAASALVLLVAFAAGMTIQAGRIARERDRANREAQAASRVTQFLVDLFEVSDPGAAQGASIPAREILDRGADRIERELGGQPELQARLMITMGSVFKKMGLYAEALPLLRRAEEIRLAELGVGHPDTIRAKLEIAELLFFQGKLDEAQTLLEEARRRGLESLGRDHTETIAALADLAVVAHFSGRLDEAQALFREALAERTRVLGPDHLDTLETVNNLAALHAARGDLAGAEPYCRAALEGRERALGPTHPETLDSVINLGYVLQALGRLDEAEDYTRRAVDVGRRVLPDHPKTLVAINNLGKLLEVQGRPAEAETYYTEALASFRRMVGEEHPDTITAMGNLGDLYTGLGRFDEADRLLAAASERARRTLGQPHVVTGYTLTKYGRLLLASGRREEAARVLGEAREVLVAAVGSDHARTRTVDGLLAELRGEGPR